ncbi:MAG: hypothetical protein ABIH86_06055 [Planctomycetota bacterium]
MKRTLPISAAFFALGCLAAWLALISGCVDESSSNKNDKTPAATTLISDALLSNVRSKTVYSKESPSAASAEILVAPDQPTIADSVYLRVDLSYSDGYFPLEPDISDAFGEFIHRPPTLKKPLDPDRPGRKKTRYEFTLEPSSDGALLLRSLVFALQDNRLPSDESACLPQFITLETPPLIIQVSSDIKPEDIDLAKIGTAMVPIRPPSVTNWRLIISIITILSVVAGVVIAREIGRRDQILLTPELTPVDEALRALNRLLESSLIASGDYPAFYVELTRLVRRYIERVTGIRAPEMTTEEFLREIKRRDLYAGEKKAKLEEFLRTADRIKFANEIPDSALIDQSVLRARNFVGATEASQTTSEAKGAATA